MTVKSQLTSGTCGRRACPGRYFGTKNLKAAWISEESGIGSYVRLFPPFEIAMAYYSPTTHCCPLSVTVESEGPYAPEDLFPQSISVMREKIAHIRREAEALLADNDAAPGAVAPDGDVEMGDV